MRTLVILKPDAIEKRLVGHIIGKLEGAGFKIAAMKMCWLIESKVKRHYQKYADKPFFQWLIDYMTSDQVVVLIVEGPKEADVVGIVRQIGMDVRKEFVAPDEYKNLIHTSDSPETAIKEINNLFPEAFVLA